MSKANIGWLFYKEMYKLGDSEEQIEHTLNKILKIIAVDSSMNVKDSFRLKTIYPGLLIGSGYSHGLSNNSDVKIGFYFDHTTGLPLIQGSSVKGMLRSCFGLEFGDQKDKYKKEKHEYIRDLISNKTLDVEAFAKEIFEGIDPENSKMKSIYERDVFYEARVISIKENIPLLSKDYITPHGENPCQEPQPLKFIKVSPEVMFEFSFDLKDSKLGVTAKEKKKLFMTLLEEFGIGAKTNVGYGQFETIDKENIVDTKESVKYEFSFDDLIVSINAANNGKSVKSLITKSKKNHTFTSQEKDKLKETIIEKIKKEKKELDDNWELTFSNLSNKKKRNIIGGDYVDALSNIAKE